MSLFRNNLIRFLALREIPAICLWLAVVQGTHAASPPRWEVDLNFHPGWGTPEWSWCAGITVQTDDKILALWSSDFGDKLIRLCKDGSFDSTFKSEVDTNLRSILLEANGNILLTGTNRLYRLSPSGKLLTTFEHYDNLTTNIIYDPVACQPDGKILAGVFSLPHPESGYLIRYNQDGTIDPSFECPLTWLMTWYWAIRPVEDGKIWVGGKMRLPDGSLKYLARLNPNGTVDTTTQMGSGPNDVVQEVYPGRNGQLYVFGSFTNYNGVTSPNVIRIDSNGKLDPTFISQIPATHTANVIGFVSPQEEIFVGGHMPEYVTIELNNTGKVIRTLNGIPYGLAVQSSGTLLLAGKTWPSPPFSADAAWPIVRYNLDYSLDHTFRVHAGPYLEIRSLLLLSNNQVVVGGDFRQVGRVGRQDLTLVNSSGIIDLSFSPHIFGDDSATDFALALDNSGKILVGHPRGSSDRKSIFRLLPDGTPDPSFTNNLSAAVEQLLALPDNKIIVLGQIGFANSNYAVVRLQNDGQIDSNFIPLPGKSDQGVAVNDGTYIVAGVFGTNNLVRLTSSGERHPNFRNPLSPDQLVKAMLKEPSGTILVATYTNILRISPEGAISQSFNLTLLSGSISAMAFAKTGELFVAGSHFQTKTNGTSPLLLVDHDGSILNSLPDPQASIYQIQIQEDGNILLAGTFHEILGERLNQFARLYFNPPKPFGNLTIRPISPQQAIFNFSGELGRKYILQTSTNLVNWSDLWPVHPEDSVLPTDANTKTFYRVRLN